MCEEDSQSVEGAEQLAMSQDVFSGDRGGYEEEEEVDLEGEEDTLRLFMGLLHKEASQRCSYLSHLTRSVQLWLRRRREDMTADKLLSIHMPSILRISLTCPYQDVREQLSSVLKFAKVRERGGSVCVCVRARVCVRACARGVFLVRRLPNSSSPNLSTIFALTPGSQL